MFAEQSLEPVESLAKDLSYATPAQRPPTARQLRVLRLVQDHIVARGYAPSLRELGTQMGIRSTNGVAQHLDYLERKGYVVRGHVARSVVLTEQGLALLNEERPSNPRGVVRPLPTRSGPSWMRGWIYVVEAVGCGRVKIGFTKGDPFVRAKLLQTGCPYPLRVVALLNGSQRAETDLHERFASARVASNVEWFVLGPELRAFIAEHADLPEAR